MIPTPTKIFIGNLPFNYGESDVAALTNLPMYAEGDGDCWVIWPQQRGRNGETIIHFDLQRVCTNNQARFKVTGIWIHRRRFKGMASISSSSSSLLSWRVEFLECTSVVIAIV